MYWVAALAWGSCTVMVFLCGDGHWARGRPASARHTTVAGLDGQGWAWFWLGLLLPRLPLPAPLLLPPAPSSQAKRGRVKLGPPLLAKRGSVRLGPPLHAKRGSVGAGFRFSPPPLAEGLGEVCFAPLPAPLLLPPAPSSQAKRGSV